MATGWVKSLQCKSRAFEDVYHHPNPKSLLSTSGSCRKSAQTVRDVVEMARGKPKSRAQQPPPARPKHSKPSKRDSDPNEPNIRKVAPAATVSPRSSRSLCPPLTELPEGHPSRNVVEIIFHTSWSEKSAFPGRVEKIFKVQSGPKTTARFEEYREAVKSRAGSGSGFGQGAVGGCSEDNVARCVADGNEVMRFRCMGPASAGGGISSADFSAFSGGKGAAVCTFFAGSGSAHERAGGGKGRRAMLVCRVIAGRVVKQAGPDPFLEARAGYDSVIGEKGELIVFDPRAVLPCFLIIYRL
ncbi:uncharacterized protein LOC104441888 isoform X1 [Eucalyptus grandis]|uniref:uncharacterized protein LOC104441888 isoform X1 n=1 Tax=Eucalyptus grandis TaxID=71139 RepID=UPI00192EEA88|nr:uncharacterized protein LOC104441888 isoform X1 [Eucalyptus grandis]